MMGVEAWFEVGNDAVDSSNFWQLSLLPIFRSNPNS